MFSCKNFCMAVTLLGCMLHGSEASSEDSEATRVASFWASFSPITYSKQRRFFAGIKKDRSGAGNMLWFGDVVDELHRQSALGKKIEDELVSELSLICHDENEDPQKGTATVKYIATTEAATRYLVVREQFSFKPGKYWGLAIEIDDSSRNEFTTLDEARAELND